MENKKFFYSVIEKYNIKFILKPIGIAEWLMENREEGPIDREEMREVIMDKIEEVRSEGLVEGLQSDMFEINVEVFGEELGSVNYAIMMEDFADFIPSILDSDIVNVPEFREAFQQYVIEFIEEYKDVDNFADVSSFMFVGEEYSSMIEEFKGESYEEDGNSEDSSFSSKVEDFIENSLDSLIPSFLELMGEAVDPTGETDYYNRDY